MTNFLRLSRHFDAMRMAFRPLLPAKSSKAPHRNRSFIETPRFQAGILDHLRRFIAMRSRRTRPKHEASEHPTTRRRPLGFSLQGRLAGVAPFRTDERLKRHLVGNILALLPVAFILAGCAQSLERGKVGSAAGFEPATYFDARLDETARDWPPETEQSQFDIAMTTACGAGNAFGCGLRFAWRALLALLNFFERLVTLSLIALGLPWLLSTSLRESIEKRRKKAKENAHDSSIRSPRSLGRCSGSEDTSLGRTGPAGGNQGYAGNGYAHPVDLYERSPLMDEKATGRARGTKTPPRICCDIEERCR